MRRARAVEGVLARAVEGVVVAGVHGSGPRRAEGAVVTTARALASTTSSTLDALARASYRTLLRTTSGVDPRAGAGEARERSIAPRARRVLVERVSALARVEAERLGRRERGAHESTLDPRLAFAASCAFTTAFFRRAHRDRTSPESQHARASVGYLDGARKREKRGEVREISRKERRVEETRKLVAAGCDVEPFASERARVIGMSVGLIPPLS